MNITKLIIYPTVSGADKIVINKPTISRAQTLITDKLSTSSYNLGQPNKNKIKIGKLPKNLRDFVNPETRVRPTINHIV